MFTKIAQAAALIALALAVPAYAQNRKPPHQPQLLQKALNGPLKKNSEIIFVTRKRYNDGHWYANIGYYCDDEKLLAFAANGKPDEGKLCRLDLRTGRMTVLLDARGGSLRDPQVHYDGRKILFSYRKKGSIYYNLYEINADGSNLRQITKGEFDDFEPIYLPDGDILFVSTRCNRWVNCWKTQVATMYRCSLDGRNLMMVSGNTEHDNTPWLLHDGRILYTRWEYVDRSQVGYHHLWVMNPDGTNQMTFFGNLDHGRLLIDAKPIPGTNDILVNFNPGHGRNEHMGNATILKHPVGPDDRFAERPLRHGKHVVDPYPLSPNLFLAGRDRDVLLFDDRGNVQTIYTHRGEARVHEPRPLRPRPREPVLPERVQPETTTGKLILADVYQGRHMKGVRRGDIRKLLVLELLPKPVNFSGGPDLLTWRGTFTLQRVLGTVPVEKDGSAFFEVPANRSVFFVSLDENDLSVKRMQSFASVMPGEVTGCVGCHEQRTELPSPVQTGTLAALRRPASKIRPFQGFPDVLDYHRDIQPIFDRHCVPCHGPEKREGKLILTGDLGPRFSHGYVSLLANKLIADGRNGYGNQPPRTIGSSASPLLRMLDGTHYEARLSERERRTIWLWIESGAAYAGSYAALRNEKEMNIGNLSGGIVFGEQKDVFRRRCAKCHPLGKVEVRNGIPSLPFNPSFKSNSRGLKRPVAVYERVIIDNDPIARFSSHILLNLSRPEFSALILGPLDAKAGGYGSCGTGQVFKDKNDPDYKRLLASLRKSKAVYKDEPRYATPGFRPNRQYLREMKKYGVLPASFDPKRDPIDIFETEQKYWKSLWHYGSTENPAQADQK